MIRLKQQLLHQHPQKKRTAEKQKNNETGVIERVSLRSFFPICFIEADIKCWLSTTNATATHQRHFDSATLLQLQEWVRLPDSEDNAARKSKGNDIVNRLSHLRKGDGFAVFLHVNRNHFSLLFFRKCQDNHLHCIYVDSNGNSNEDAISCPVEFSVGAFLHHVKLKLQAFRRRLQVTEERLLKKYQVRPDCAVHVCENAKILFSCSDADFNRDTLFRAICAKGLNVPIDASYYRYALAKRIQQLLHKPKRVSGIRIYSRYSH